MLLGPLTALFVPYRYLKYYNLEKKVRVPAACMQKTLDALLLQQKRQRHACNPLVALLLAARWQHHARALMHGALGPEHIMVLHHAAILHVRP
jgi:hypothetical protein